MCSGCSRCWTPKFYPEPFRLLRLWERIKVYCNLWLCMSLCAYMVIVKIGEPTECDTQVLRITIFMGFVSIFTYVATWGSIFLLTFFADLFCWCFLDHSFNYTTRYMKKPNFKASRARAVVVHHDLCNSTSPVIFDSLFGSATLSTQLFCALPCSYSRQRKGFIISTGQVASFVEYAEPNVDTLHKTILFWRSIFDYALDPNGQNQILSGRCCSYPGTPASWPFFRNYLAFLADLRFFVLLDLVLGTIPVLLLYRIMVFLLTIVLLLSPSAFRFFFSGIVLSNPV